MKLYFCPNQSTSAQVRAARACIETMEVRLHAWCALSAADSGRIFGDLRRAELPAEACDMIVSIGGDGAVLRAAQLATALGKPLLGINGGRLGYLCGLELEDVAQLTPALFESWPISPRTLLRFDYGGREHLAVNDVMVVKRSFGSTVELEISLRERPLTEVRGDGVLVATPTGSTAYNLSAGGPVLLPDAACLALTPICPHGSDARSWVVSDEEIVRIDLKNPASNEACLYADGVLLGPIHDTITVHRARRRLQLLARREALFPAQQTLYKEEHHEPAF